MTDKWYLTSFEEWSCREAYHIVVLTDAPCHLWLRWSNNSPWKHPRTRTIRGLNIEGDVYYCFTAYHDVEQDETGDTLEHTFTVSPWQRFEHRWFFFWGEVAGVQSPSMSPIFARYLDMSSDYSFTTITHEADVAVIFMNNVSSFPPSCPAFLTLGLMVPLTDLQGGALRFRNCQLPKCAEVLKSHLVVNAAWNYATDPVHARLSAENAGHADDFDSITTPQFWARYAGRTGIVDWNNLPHFLMGEWYETPSLIAPVQNVVSRPDWTTGNAIVLFCEDFDQRTPPPANNIRVIRTYAPPLPFSPVLHVWYNRWYPVEVSAF